MSVIRINEKDRTIWLGYLKSNRQGFKSRRLASANLQEEQVLRQKIRVGLHQADTKFSQYLESYSGEYEMMNVEVKA